MLKIIYNNTNYKISIPFNLEKQQDVKKNSLLNMSTNYMFIYKKAGYLKKCISTQLQSSESVYKNHGYIYLKVYNLKLHIEIIIKQINN